MLESRHTAFLFFKKKKGEIIMINIDKIIKEKKYDPVEIGAAILEAAGYKVKLQGIGYSGLIVSVYDKEGRVVHENAYE